MLHHIKSSLRFFRRRITHKVHLTPQERLIIYEAVLTELLYWIGHYQINNFLCPLLRDEAVRLKLINRKAIINIEKDFPEFYAQKPKHVLHANVWWGSFDNQERVMAMENAIKLTKLEINWQNLKNK